MIKKKLSLSGDKMKIYLSFFCLFFLSGCIINQTNLRYGNVLTSKDNQNYGDFFIDRTIEFIEKKFPDKETIFVYENKKKDIFEEKIINRLRVSGYKIFLNSALPKTEEFLISANIKSEKRKNVYFKYFIRKITETNFFALTLIFNHSSFNKIFFEENGNLYSSGAWVQENIDET